MQGSKIKYLVVDTSAFIKNAPVQELGENLVTCQDVINEVTCKRQLRRLVVLPYDLKVKEVSPENVKFVSEFSKKTGDYPSLSATDIKVIALTYQLEKELVGSTSHLHETPEFHRSISFLNKPVIDLKDTAGFYIPSKERKNELAHHKNPSDTSENTSTVLASKFSMIELSKSDEEQNHQTTNSISQNVGDSHDIDVSTILVEISGSSATVAIKETISKQEASPNVDDGCTGKEEEETDEEINNDDDDDDDDEGWITPSNIKEMTRQINAEFEEDRHVQVACLTADFAMQNVLKQIGLHVSSVDGKIIKQMRTFILRCYACFKTTSIMTKIFCPHCGHKTLKRVAVTVEPDGTQKIHLNAKKQITTKGKNVSVPMFQGGKHSNNPILFADQPLPDQRPSRIARTKTNILDGDFIAGFSPFALRDTTSKSAMLGIRAKEMKHWMRNSTATGRKKK